MVGPLAQLRDPALPGLPALQHAAVGRVLAHKPGRRATVLVTGAGGARIAKLFAPSEIGAALETSLASLRHARLAPRLLDVDTDGCVLWLEVVAGAPLDAAAADRRDLAVARLGRVLTEVHAAPTAGLPPWDAGHPARKLRRHFEAALEVAPEVVGRASRVVDRLDRAVPVGRGAPVFLHGDHSLRNVMHDEATGELRLVDWDRSAVGPREVDLAPIAGLLRDSDFLRGYREAGGTVDEELLARLVLMNRLTRALRRVLRGADGPAVASHRLRELLQDVAQHGL